MITDVSGCRFLSSLNNAIPSIPGILTSVIMTENERWETNSIASLALLAVIAT